MIDRVLENPTTKAIQERISKLRIETEQMLNEDNLTGIQAELNLIPESEPSESESPLHDTASSPTANRSLRTYDSSPAMPAKTKKKQSRSIAASPVSPGFDNLTTPEEMAGVANLMVLGALDRQRGGRFRAVMKDGKVDD